MKNWKYSFKGIDVHTRWQNSKGYVYEVIAIANVGNIHERHPVQIVYRNIINDYVYCNDVEYFKQKMQPVSHGHKSAYEVTPCLLLQPDQKPKRNLLARMMYSIFRK